MADPLLIYERMARRMSKREGMAMLGARGGLATQRRYRAEGRDSWAAARLAQARKVIAEHEAKERAGGAAGPGVVAFLPIE